MKKILTITATYVVDSDRYIDDREIKTFEDCNEIDKENIAIPIYKLKESDWDVKFESLVDVVEPEENNNQIVRYVIRRIKEKDYYNGHNTFGYVGDMFGDFSKAKVYKNAAGAKVACGDLYLHTMNEVEIVEITTNVTENIIKYKGSDGSLNVDDIVKLSKDEANKTLSDKDKAIWVEHHNETAKLYRFHNGEIVDIEPAGWWY